VELLVMPGHYPKGKMKPAKKYPMKKSRGTKKKK